MVELRRHAALAACRVLLAWLERPARPVACLMRVGYAWLWHLLGQQPG